MYLTSEEQGIMSWSAEAVKAPWVALLDVWSRMHAGEKLSREDGLIDPFFLPFDIDARALYYAIKAGGPAVLGSNATMLTIVTNTECNSIIWAAAEAAEECVYVEFQPLKDKLGQEWDKKGAELIATGDLDAAFDHFSAWMKTQPNLEHMELGILKVANIQFFNAFRKAYEESSNGENLPLMVVKMADAVNEILANDWVRFSPDINFKKILGLAAPVLSTLNPVNLALQKALEKIHV